MVPPLVAAMAGEGETAGRRWRGGPVLSRWVARGWLPASFSLCRGNEKKEEDDRTVILNPYYIHSVIYKIYIYIVINLKKM